MELVRLYGVGGLAGAVNPANLKTHLGVFLMYGCSAKCQHSKRGIHWCGEHEAKYISLCESLGHSINILQWQENVDLIAPVASWDIRSRDCVVL